MGLFDAVVGAVGSMGSAGGGAGGADLMGVVGKLLQDSGGLAGLVQKFQQGGLGEVAQSWVSTGQNLPVSADQLGQVLGPDLLAKLGGGAGGGSDLLGSLAQFLPQVVDQLTPGGELPAGGGTDVGALLGQLMGGAGGAGGAAGSGGADLAGMLGGLLGKK